MLEKGLWQSAVELQRYLESSRLSFDLSAGWFFNGGENLE